MLKIFFFIFINISTFVHTTDLLIMEEKDLIHAITKGDDVVFKDLFMRYYQPIVGYINTFTNDLHLSEDIVQQSFIKIWKQRKDLDVTKSTKSYLYTIAYNTYIDNYRKQRREDVVLDTLREQAIRESIAEDTEIMEARITRLKQLVTQLPPRCREILILNKLEGLTYKQIAEKLELSQKTVESQMRIAYQKIREGFENDGIFMFILTKTLKHFKQNTIAP